MAESFLWGLPLIGRRPRPLRFGGGKWNRLASRRKRVTTQTWLPTAARNSMAANALSATRTMYRSGSQRWICSAAWRAQSSRVLGAGQEGQRHDAIGPWHAHQQHGG